MNVVRQGRSPAYLIIEHMTAAPGAAPDKTAELSSDVVTGSTAFEDIGTASFTIALKDRDHRVRAGGEDRSDLLR